MFTTSTTFKVQYRSLSKSGLKISVPIVSQKLFDVSAQHSLFIDIH